MSTFLDLPNDRQCFYFSAHSPIHEQLFMHLSFLFSVCRNKKLDAQLKCASCNNIIENPNTWGNAELAFSLPKEKRSITVWKPDLVTLFQLPDFGTLTGATLEDAIALELPQVSQVSGKTSLHKNKILKIQKKRKSTE